MEMEERSKEMGIEEMEERIKEIEERRKEMGIEEMEERIKEMEVMEKEEMSKGPIKGKRLELFLVLLSHMVRMQFKVAKMKDKMMKMRKLKIETSEGEGEPEEEHEVEEEDEEEEEAKKKLIWEQASIEYKNLRFRELTESVKRELKVYWDQVVSSGGFDIDRCPPDYQCVISPVCLDHDDDDAARNFKVKLHHRLCHLSALALAKYNTDNATDFIFSKYLKANQAPCAGTNYYITFEAKEDSEDYTFQAFVHYGIPIWNGTQCFENINVKLVRMKSAASEKDNPILLSYIE